MNSIAILTAISVAAFVLLMLMFVALSGIEDEDGDASTSCGRIADVERASTTVATKATVGGWSCYADANCLSAIDSRMSTARGRLETDEDEGEVRSE